MEVHNREISKEGNNDREQISDAELIVDLSNGSGIVSPYATSEILSLDLGGARYLIHSKVLRKSAPLYELASTEQTELAPELRDSHIAHPLIHYLYSGNLSWDPQYDSLGKFNVASRLYSVAVLTELPGLAELAKNEALRSGDGLDIMNMLGMVRHHRSRILLEDKTWYWQYIESAIQKAVDSNPEPFKQPDIITRFEGNSRLLQIVWKTVMSSLPSGSTYTASTRDVNSGAVTPLAESALTESEATTQDSLHQLPSPTESVIDSPPILKQTDDLIEPQKLDLDASAVSDLPRKPASDRFDDTNDFTLPDIEPLTTQSEAVQIVAASVEDIKKPEHIRSDSVVEEDAIAPVALKSGSEPAKKNKKKGKKGKSSIMF
ncbi:hypothetical protein E8E13_002032 [Curvularia kusanoi]|uniref:BTB domain-containing protein n=1 Tax=Curvularia kusanoi TaxID=90978 RepID=A0A9P4W264_CURKU|nr:hypothetical protein E8E13_002032 [Curvularia kusanoi]